MHFSRSLVPVKWILFASILCRAITTSSASEPRVLFVTIRARRARRITWWSYFERPVTGTLLRWTTENGRINTSSWTRLCPSIVPFRDATLSNRPATTRRGTRQRFPVASLCDRVSKLTATVRREVDREKVIWQFARPIWKWCNWMSNAAWCTITRVGQRANMVIFPSPCFLLTFSPSSLLCFCFLLRRYSRQLALVCWVLDGRHEVDFDHVWSGRPGEQEFPMLGLSTYFLSHLRHVAKRWQLLPTWTDGAVESNGGRHFSSFGVAQQWARV